MNKRLAGFTLYTTHREARAAADKLKMDFVRVGRNYLVPTANDRWMKVHTFTANGNYRCLIATLKHRRRIYTTTKRGTWHYDSVPVRP